MLKNMKTKYCRANGAAISENDREIIEAAKKSARLIILFFAFIKIGSYFLFMEPELLRMRIITGVILIATVFLLTQLRRLPRFAFAVLVPALLLLIELIHAWATGGDRLIYFFVIGIALISLSYGSLYGLVCSIIVNTIFIAVFTFVLKVNINSPYFEHSLQDGLFYFLGMVVVLVLVFLYSKYSIGLMKKQQEDLEQSKNEAVAASDTKTRFLATMSHEIRTPMNSILGITQMELQDSNLPEKNIEALERIYASGNTLLRIINDILDMSKIETGKLEINPIEYDVPSLIHDSAQLNVGQIGSKDITFHVDVSEELPSNLIGDELRLRQILNNLLSNAFKYTEKGDVKLTVTHTAQGEDVTLQFVVEDTGQGMKPEDLNKLFSAYTRFNIKSNRYVEGTGIGLNITKTLTELMNGSISVESEYGKGSKFTVNVLQKAVSCPPIGNEVRKNLKNFAFFGKKERRNVVIEIMSYGKVLIVDDVDTNLYVARGLMSPYQLQIKTATSGFKAIETVENNEVYDVIFMDHMMPQMNGIETTKRLRESGYKGTIVALTANAMVGNAEMFKSNGFDDFISKPIDVRQLNTILNKWVRDKHPLCAKKYAGQAVQPAAQTIPTKDPKLIEVFRKDAGKAVAILQETASNGDLRLFTVTAHAMKAALINIGETKKSELAKALEAAGNNGDTEYISANIKNFIKILETLIEELAPIKSDDSDVEEDVAFLKEQLAVFKAACEEYDEKNAYAAIDKMKEKQWKSETLTVIEEIRDMLFLGSDFEGAADKVRELLGE